MRLTLTKSVSKFWENAICIWEILQWGINGFLSHFAEEKEKADEPSSGRISR